MFYKRTILSTEYNMTTSIIQMKLPFLGTQEGLNRENFHVVQTCGYSSDTPACSPMFPEIYGPV